MATTRNDRESSRRRWLSAGAALCMISVALMLWLQSPNKPQVAHDTTQEPRRISPAEAGESSPAHQREAPVDLSLVPMSLQGTEPPPGLIIDGQGRLVVRKTLREFFDYFLSALGEEPLISVRARILDHMRRSLPHAAYMEAHVILDDYLAYRQALNDLPRAEVRSSTTLDLEAVTAHKQKERALRTRFLAPMVATAFFDDEDRHDDYTLARHRIQADRALSETERAARQAELFAQLPAETQARLQSLQTLQVVERIQSDCLKQGCTPESLHLQRTAAAGPEAAERLRSLDERRAAWTARVTAYLAQRKTIFSNQSLSESERRHQIDKLQQAGFTPEERLRLATLELATDPHP